MTDAEFLSDYDPSPFPKPSVAVDVVLLTVDDARLQVLLVERSLPPARGRLALPGGFVRMAEGLDAAASRVLSEKAHLQDVFLEQLYTFGSVDRDPRMRVISVCYYALVPAGRLQGATGTRVDIEVPWAGEKGGPVRFRDADGHEVTPAFDHGEMVSAAVLRVRGKLSYTDISFALLPERFTLRQLQELHETLLGRPLNKDSFRRSVLHAGLVVPTGDRQQAVGHRPAALYRPARPGR